MFASLPQEIQREIYLFDPTYHEIFKQCLEELTSKILKVHRFTRYTILCLKYYVLSIWF